MIVILDDREDVWKNHLGEIPTNLIKIPPCNYFFYFYKFKYIYKDIFFENFQEVNELPIEKEKIIFENNNLNKEIELNFQELLKKDQDNYLLIILKILHQVHKIFYSPKLNIKKKDTKVYIFISINIYKYT